MTDPNKATEKWMFAGTRLGKANTKQHAWLPLPADDLDGELWFKARGSYVIGSIYEVPVTRDDEKIIKHGVTFERIGPHDDTELRALAEARHTAAETTLRVKRIEAADKRDSALDEALAPLVGLSAQLHPTERTAFLAYVIQRITKPWS